jgi:hypothetical protein
MLHTRTQTIQFNFLTTGNFCIRILTQVGIKDGVTYLITHFVCTQKK